MRVEEPLCLRLWAASLARTFSMSCGACTSVVVAEQLAGGCDVRPCKQRDVFALMAADHCVLQQRRGRVQCGDADMAGEHPGAGHELEVLRESAVEHESLGRIVGVLQAAGVAGA